MVQGNTCSIYPSVYDFRGKPWCRETHVQYISFSNNLEGNPHSLYPSVYDLEGSPGAGKHMFNVSFSYDFD